MRLAEEGIFFKYFLAGTRLGREGKKVRAKAAVGGIMRAIEMP